MRRLTPLNANHWCFARKMAAVVAVSVSPTIAWANCPAGEQALPFTPASAHAPLLVVEGTIDGDAVAVVVDTGGSAPFDLFLSPRRAGQLGLTLSEEIAPPDTTAVGPARQTYRTATLPDFRLGSVTLENRPIAVVPMIDAMEAQVGRRIDAIVGQQFLSNRRVAIDYGRNLIDLDATPGGPGDAIAFSFAARKPLILIPMTINGRGPFQMELDTGATRTSLSPAAARRARVSASGSGRLGGAGGEVSVGLGQADLRLASVSRRTPVAITPAVDQVARSAGSPIDGILGTDFLAGACLVIDYTGRTIRIQAGA